MVVMLWVSATRSFLIQGLWTTSGVIDFGDAMLGDLYYELAALHLDLFAGDKRLLTDFLEAYGLTPETDFPYRAMITALMHQFDVFGSLFAYQPSLAEVKTLEELAACLWDVRNE